MKKCLVTDASPWLAPDSVIPHTPPDGPPPKAPFRTRRCSGSVTQARGEDRSPEEHRVLYGRAPPSPPAQAPPKLPARVSGGPEKPFGKAIGVNSRSKQHILSSRRNSRFPTGVLVFMAFVVNAPHTECWPFTVRTGSFWRGGRSPGASGT